MNFSRLSPDRDRNANETNAFGGMDLRDISIGVSERRDLLVIATENDR